MPPNFKISRIVSVYSSYRVDGSLFHCREGVLEGGELYIEEYVMVESVHLA